MDSLAVAGIVAALVMFVVVSELVAAAIPMIIVITLVPPHERADLARVLAAADSSRRLRLWPALRLATTARRRQRDRHHRS